MPTGLITFIVPAYNAERTIGAALSGILVQGRDDIDAVVVDDGSSDATAEIASAHPRVRVVSQANGGLSAARNAAISVAQGEYFAWCDADDILLPGYLDAMVKTVESGPSRRTIATSDALLLTPSGISGRRLMPAFNPPPSRQVEGFFARSFISVFCLYHRSLHDEVGLLDPAVTRGEDRDLWMRALMRGWRARRQPKPLALYRWTGQSMSSDMQAMSSAEQLILDRVAADPEITLTIRQRQVLDTLRTHGTVRDLQSREVEALRRGDLQAARSAIRLEAKVLPEDRTIWMKQALSRVPGALQALRLRQRRIDRQLGYNEEMRR